MMVEMFVVYNHPRDYPDKFVIRRWAIGQGTSPLEIRADVSPVMYFAIAVRFTPTADDGSKPLLTMAHFVLTGEI